MEKLTQDLICLLSCAANGTTPDPERISGIDMEQMYKLCRSQSIRATVYPVLERAGAGSNDFAQAYHKSVRKNILLDIERKAITDQFEEQGIWYLEMKGSLMKELYPAPGMREMSDNDILIDSSCREKANKIMTERGYTAKRFMSSHCDEYTKPPVMNFELHSYLFEERLYPQLQQHYRDMSALMIKNSDDSFGYHLSDEEAYIYMTAHEYKHFIKSGTGIRGLVDCYIFLKEKGEALDWDRISSAAKEMGMDQFEKKRRELAFKLLSDDKLPELTDEEESFMMEYLKYGIYGLTSKRAENDLKRFQQESGKSGAGFVLSRLFPSPAYIKKWYPFAQKNPLLLPAAYVLRWYKALTTSKDKTKSEIRALRNKK
ncbi:MAG: nucleotidyltransferase family protein [Ruminococcus sp.]|nr:nucleotidyltransferase family protein [Ruminococcus sp.]